MTDDSLIPLDALPIEDEEEADESQRQKQPWPKLEELFMSFKGSKPDARSEDALQGNPAVLTTIYLPRSKNVPHHLHELRDPLMKMHDYVFERGCRGWNTPSNMAVAHIAQDLSDLDYKVDRFPKGNRIDLPILFGPDGNIQRRHQADAYKEIDGRGTVVEIEAGTAVANNAYLKDIFEASMVDSVDYLVLAVRKLYQADKGSANPHFQFVKRALDTIYTSHRLTLPLKGVWLVGY